MLKCQHQSAGISPPDGHLHVVLDDDEHLPVPPLPGPPPRGHDPSVGLLSHQHLPAMAELEVPRYVFNQLSLN